MNESLMRTFISVGLSEHTGHGVPVVTRAYGEAAYEFTGGSVKVTLTFPRKRGASRYRDSTLPSLKENEALVLEAIKAHPNFTLDEIAELTGLGRSTVGKIVPSLRKAGIVKRKGSKRDREWVVNENQSL